MSTHSGSLGRRRWTQSLCWPSYYKPGKKKKLVTYLKHDYPMLEWRSKSLLNETGYTFRSFKSKRNFFWGNFRPLFTYQPITPSDQSDHQTMNFLGCNGLNQLRIFNFAYKHTHRMWNVKLLSTDHHHFCSRSWSFLCVV